MKKFASGLLALGSVLVATSAQAAVDAGVTTLLADVGTTWDSVVVIGLGILSVVLVIGVVKKLRRIS